MDIGQFRKAVVAGFTAGAAVYVSSAILNNWLIQVGAAFGAGLAVGLSVFMSPNDPATPAVIPHG